jgi:hypothetical protein
LQFLQSTLLDMEAPLIEPVRLLAYQERLNSFTSFRPEPISGLSL